MRSRQKALAFAVLDLTGSVGDLGLVVGARSLANLIFLLFGECSPTGCPGSRSSCVSDHVIRLPHRAAAITDARAQLLIEATGPDRMHILQAGPQDLRQPLRTRTRPGPRCLGHRT
jgi:hypothetical protein